MASDRATGWVVQRANNEQFSKFILDHRVPNITTPSPFTVQSRGSQDFRQPLAETQVVAKHAPHLPPDTSLQGHRLVLCRVSRAIDARQLPNDLRWALMTRPALQLAQLHKGIGPDVFAALVVDNARISYRLQRIATTGLCELGATDLLTPLEKTMPLNIGISGGHTRSTAIAIHDQQIVGSAVGPGLNDHASIETAYACRNDILIDKMWRLLASLVDSINRNALYSNRISSSRQLCQLVENAVISLPGVTTVHDVGRAEISFLPLRFANQFIIDDTWGVLVAGLHSATGIAVIAGTGASTFVGLGDFQLGKQYKFDGFGALLGDWGSGFRMAVRLLEEAARSCDSRGSFPLEVELIQELYKLHKMQDIQLNTIQNWFDDLVRSQPADWRITLAKLSRVVTQHNPSNSSATAFSLRLIRESAFSLARTVQSALRSLKRDRDRFPVQPADPLPIVCKGGQLENSPDYYRALVAELRRFGHKNRVIQSEFDTSVGSALFAAQGSTETYVRTKQTDMICESIRNWPDAQMDGLIVRWLP